MNKIIESFLNIHVAEYNLQELKKEIAFEHFINRCIVNKYVIDRFDPQDIMTEPGERGIDGIAIIVNDRLILSEDDISEEINKTQLSVNFVFIQSKTSDNFSSSEIGDFTRGVKAFFEPLNNRPKTNFKIENLIKIKDILYSHSIKFKIPPALELFYACCGKWNEDNGLRAGINIDINPLIESQNFSRVDFLPYDSEKIITTYKELKKKVVRSITMDKKISFPPIDGIIQAYLGIVKCNDFISLLRDSDGNMLTNIFEDNVRDFQGYNAVNKEIKETLFDKKDQERFAVLNNGITIVTKNIQATGDILELFDYQIVNGCQTSYVLFDNADKISINSFIVVKVIQVSNEDISDRIIFTTNRQTEVKAEAFTSTNLFHKRLQDYYNAIDVKYRLYYERRSKQYDLCDDVDKNRVVTLASQIQSYVAMFLNEPHSTHRYYGELLNAYSSKLFLDTDAYDLYYICAYFNYYLDKMFRTKQIEWKYKRLKFHILLALRVYHVGSQVIFGRAREQKKFFEKLFLILGKEDVLQNTIKTSIMCIDRAIDKLKTIPMSDIHRSRDVTNEIIRQVGLVTDAEKSTCYLKSGDIVHCTVLGVDSTYVNVKLKTEDSRHFGYIHISNVSQNRISNLRREINMGEVFQAKILSDSYYDSKWGWELTKILSKV